MKCTIVTIGDEILVGQIVDTNSAWLGVNLNELGVDVIEILSVSDKDAAIKEALDRSLKASDLVLVTGGLGPTKDDITKKSIAEYFGVSMYFHQETFDRLTAIFAKFNRPTSEAHKAQCFMPENAKVLTNEMGTAPGMLFEHNDTVLVSMPGVPFEMKYLFNTHLVPLLKAKIGDSHVVYHKTIMTYGEGESILADKIEEVVSTFPKGISIAYLPSLGYVRLRISGKGGVELLPQVDAYTEQIVDRIQSNVYGYDNEFMEEAVKRLCIAKNLKLGTAESCTGGFLSHKLTSVPGSSAYFLGGVVSYSNDVKVKQLGVKPETLASFGAVSSETVVEMAEGCLAVLDTDIAISLSGIAGPDGGTAEKPVGTIWIALAQKGFETKSIMIKASKDRINNITYAANVAMGMILRRLLNS